MAISNTERRTEGQSGNGKTAFRILVCDPIAEDGVEALKRSGADVDVRTGLSPEELWTATTRWWCAARRR